MKTLELTSEQFVKAIDLGYYEIIKDISVLKKTVKHYKVCGRTEIIDISIED
jgi:hypothetical protein